MRDWLIGWTSNVYISKAKCHQTSAMYSFGIEVIFIDHIGTQLRNITPLIILQGYFELE